MPLDDTQSPHRYVAPAGVTLDPNDIQKIEENYQDIKQSRMGHQLDYIDFVDRYFTDNLQIDLQDFDGMPLDNRDANYQPGNDLLDDISIQLFDHYNHYRERGSHHLQNIFKDILNVEPKNATAIEHVNTERYQLILLNAEIERDLPLKHQNTVRELSEVLRNNPLQFRDYTKLASHIHNLDNTAVELTSRGVEHKLSQKYEGWRNARSTSNYKRQEDTYQTENFKDFLNVRYSDFRGLCLSDEPLPQEKDGILPPTLYTAYRENLETKITARLNKTDRNLDDCVIDLANFRETDIQRRIIDNIPRVNGNGETKEYVKNKF